MSKPNKQYATIAVVALVLGYVAGLLTAPKSGKETRKDIRDVADRTLKEAERRLKFAHSELAQLLAKATDQAQVLGGRAKTELEILVGKANIAREKVRQVLSSFHEGEASKTDLEDAIDDAEKLIEDLKKFLDKQ
jgi:gas vesicle protein